MPSLYKKHGNKWGKQCSDCKIDYIVEAASIDEAYTKLRKNFSPRKNARDGMESGCYRCRAIATMRIKFGVNIVDMITSQNDKCAICEVLIEFNTGMNHASACIDHDHSTGITRGILCRSCNLGLGHFKDDIELLLKASEYLVRNRKING